MELLNQKYDVFTAKWGLINSTGNQRAFSQDASYYLLSSLEVLDEEGNLKRKSRHLPSAHDPEAGTCPDGRFRSGSLICIYGRKSLRRPGLYVKPVWET